MNNIPTIKFDDIYEFCTTVDDEFHRYYYAMKENCYVDITIIVKYAKAREVINYFTTEEGFELANVNFHDPDFDGYNDEYLVTLCCGLSNNDSKEIWCEPAKNEDGYIINEGNIVYLFDECNSTMIPQVQGDKTYIVELDEDLDEDFDDEFLDDLELGYHCNEDCENCYEYDKDDYVTIELSKDEVELLHKLYHIFNI